MLNKKNLTLAAAVLTALAIFAGCAPAAALSPETTLPAAEPAPALLDLGQAKAIAYTHAGVDETAAADKSYDFDDGVYEIEFDQGGWEYDYRIAPDGTILHAEKTPEPTRPAETQPRETLPAETKPAEKKSTEKSTGSDRISAEKALSIALNHAGVTDVRDRDVEWDDGRWEVSFDAGRTEYDYYIAADGSILRWDQEHND
jgi:uncharacterized membrane protein YkoI